MKEFFAKHWKNILLILMCTLFLTTCAKKNNYKRKLAAYGENATVCIDSLENVIHGKTVSFDSLLQVNKELNKDIDNLKKDIEIYRDQNDKLHNKKVTVIVKENRSAQ